MSALVLAFLLSAAFVRADSWNNDAGIYALAPLPAAPAEALRLDTNERKDQPSLGRTVLAGINC